MQACNQERGTLPIDMYLFGKYRLFSELEWSVSFTSLHQTNLIYLNLNKSIIKYHS